MTANESILGSDFLIDSTIEGVASAPPTSPVAGLMWLVGPNPSGDFAGKTDNLAGWSDGGWRFFGPHEGMRVFDRSASAFRLYLQAWALAAAPASTASGSVIDAE